MTDGPAQISEVSDMAGDGWRFLTWNLDWWQRRPERVPRASLLARYDADVVALQEVRGSVAKALRCAHPGPALFSQELHPPATWGWMGCGLLLREGTVVLDSGVLDTLPKPQRCVWARVVLPDAREVTVVSWHTPNAANDGREVKMAVYEAMSAWLERAPRPVVIGADLNTWHDPVDLAAADPADDFFHEHEFVGADRTHGLIDAYRAVLDRDGQLDRMRAAGHTGPLAASHILSNGAEHRMDRIFASPELVPSAGGYDLPGAEASGSDHAVHWIDFHERRIRSRGTEGAARPQGGALRQQCRQRPAARSRRAGRRARGPAHSGCATRSPTPAACGSQQIRRLPWLRWRSSSRQPGCWHRRGTC